MSLSREAFFSAPAAHFQMDECGPTDKFHVYLLVEKVVELASYLARLSVWPKGQRRLRVGQLPIQVGDSQKNAAFVSVRITVRSIGASIHPIIIANGLMPVTEV